MLEQDFEDVLTQALKDTKLDFDFSVKEVAVYAAQRAAFLATVVGQLGYEQAVIAERDNVALYAGLKSVEMADASQQRLIGVIQGALSFGAKLAVAA
jgi:hypothetical protein